MAIGVRRPNTKRRDGKSGHKNIPQETIDKLFAVQDSQPLSPLPQADQTARSIGGLMMVKRSQINIYHQVRRDARSSIANLRENIAEMKNRNLGIENTGILQALLVTPAAEAGRYDLIAGERRFWASETILDELPVIVVPSNARATYLMQGIENLKRRDLSPLEEAEFVASLRNEQGLSIRDTAALLGEHKGWVENRVKVANAAPDVKELLSVYTDSPGATLTNAVIIQNEKNPVLRARLAQAATDGATEKVLRVIIAAHKKQHQQQEHIVARVPNDSNVVSSTTRDKTTSDELRSAAISREKKSLTEADRSQGQSSEIPSSEIPSARHDPLGQSLRPAVSLVAEAARLIPGLSLTDEYRTALRQETRLLRAQLDQVEVALNNSPLTSQL